MRRPQPFEIFQPTSLSEASAIMKALAPDGHFLAGGTDLTIAIKEKGLVPRFVVDLKRIPGLSGIQEDTGGGLSIGSLTTLYEVETSETITDRWPFLAQSAAEVGSIQIRNRGTIGGNLANGSPSADVVPSLLVLDVEVCIANGPKERIVRLEDFFLGPGQTAMASGDILTKILIPPTDQRLRGEYIKFSPRETMDLANVGVAVTITMGPENRCEKVRIALGAVSPTPVRAKKAEALLLGRVLTEELAEEVGNQAARECRPISDVRSSTDYRTEMVRAISKRALLNAVFGDRGPISWTERRSKRY